MKPVTTIISDYSNYQLKVAIMHSEAHKRSMVKTEVHESNVLKGFIFRIKRGKTCKCEELV